jgi:hypothetical protein
MLFAFPSSDYAEADMGGIMTNIGGGLYELKAVYP